MKELICPNCHTTFQVDDSVYAAILAQVRGKEFDMEIKRRSEELKQQYESREATAKMEVEKTYDRLLADQKQQLADMQNEITRLKGKIDAFNAQKQSEIIQLESDKNKTFAEAMATKDLEIAQLKNQLANISTSHQLDLTNERNATSERLHKKDQEIIELQSKLESQKIAAEKQELELKEQHQLLMTAKNAEIERLRDMKLMLSTKMLGETLEQHCQNAFNMARSMGSFQDAYFEKDNDASGGSKGDFIFRDFIDGEECVSIMFEMKNEADTTAAKHRNEDFFAKLDRDRNEKKCEYAVLVSMLESDSEFYNSGIVDVSHRYPKMYVVRPQFFMPVISLLSRCSKRGAKTIISLRQELVEAKAQSIDITKFEERRDAATQEFVKYANAHKDKTEQAISAIDKAIESAEKQINNLRKIKALFDTSNQKINRAVDVLENNFTIRKLCHGNPTMRAKFEEVKKAKEDEMKEFE